MKNSFRVLVPKALLLAFTSAIALGCVAMTQDIGWNRMVVEPSEQVTTFSVGDRDVGLSIGTYVQSQADPDLYTVEITVTSDGEPMPTLTDEYYVHPLSERDPGVYRFKNVDGDRTKDFVIRLGDGESNHEFYYISSRDGKGYRTDKTLQSSQPWSSRWSARRSDGWSDASN